VRYHPTGLASKIVDYRVYLNVHPQHAISAFRKVLELASVEPPSPQASPPPQAAQAPPPANPSGRKKLARVFPHTRPAVPPAPSLPAPGWRPQTSQPQGAQRSFCGQIVMAKIGDENGMF